MPTSKSSIKTRQYTYADKYPVYATNWSENQKKLLSKILTEVFKT